MYIHICVCLFIHVLLITIIATIMIISFIKTLKKRNEKERK